MRSSTRAALTGELVGIRGHVLKEVLARPFVEPLKACASRRR